MERVDMVEHQIRNRGIVDKRLLDAFLSVPRHRFVDPREERWAYGDFPLSIGYGQTISQPYIVALMINRIDLKESDNVLEIGTGSGYQTALLAGLAKQVYTVERIEPLAQRAKSVLRSLGLLNIRYRVDDGYLGWSEFAPYDSILVSAATSEIPSMLVEQLKIGGKMVLPVGGPYEQDLILVTKTQNGIEKKLLSGCRFVPLVKGNRRH